LKTEKQYPIHGNLKDKFPDKGEQTLHETGSQVLNPAFRQKRNRLIPIQAFKTAVRARKNRGIENPENFSKASFSSCR